MFLIERLNKMKIQDLVENTPLPPLETNEQPGFCPYCGSKDIVEKEGETTCVGSLSYWNVNHRWYKVKCNSCGKSCTREIKTNNEWYTFCTTNNETEIILGMPSCFESYIYKCKCGGSIHRDYRELDSEESTKITLTSFINGKWVNQYRFFFVCDKCGDYEIEDDYWDGYDTSNDPRNHIKQTNKFMISEEPGISIINTSMFK
jgi:predicted nucleic-acid-binding Zn-ribbon protein